MKDLKEQLDRPRAVALYTSLTMDFSYVTEVSYVRHDENYEPLPNGQKRERPLEGYVRVSQPVEINLLATDNDSMLQNAAASLDEEERKARNELEAKLVKIRDCRSQLLALTHQAEGVE